MGARSALGVLLVLLCACIAMGLYPNRHAQAQAPETVLRAARHAESRADPAEASRLYTQLLEAAPESRLGRIARRRLEWLEARSEDDYRTLTAVEHMRRQSGDLNGEAVVELEHALAEAPPGLARREGLLLVAESYLALDAGRRAITAFELLGRESDLSESERRRAISGQARGWLLVDDPSRAVSLLESSNLGDTALAARANEARRSQLGRRIAFGGLLLFLIAAAALGGRRLSSPVTWRRAFSRRRLWAGSYAVGVPWLVASLFDHAAFDTFAWLALGSAGVLAASSLAGACLAQEAQRRRWTLAAAGVLAEICVAYLVLAELGQVLSFSA